MVTRRRFIKTTGYSLAALGILDPFLKSLAQLTQQRGIDITKLITHTCEIHRKEDFLIFDYYFINLVRSGNSLVVNDNKKNAFIIIKLRQLHVGEEVKRGEAGKPWSFDNSCEAILPPENKDRFSKSYISGFSYQVLKVRDTPRRIPYTADSLLSWNDFDLVTLEHLPSYPKDIPVVLKENDSYPIELNDVPGAVLSDSLPVTIYEAPYKMYLSPINPSIRPVEGTTYKYGFLNDNKAVRQLQKKVDTYTYSLYQLWTNGLVYKGFHAEKGITLIPPHFKFVAYEETPEEVYLLPDPDPKIKDRSNLAKLTNVQSPERDVKADYFNLTCLGVTAFLNYYNLENIVDGTNYRIVKWKQDIVLGRDNYVEITVKGIDIRSGLKVLVSTIAERRIEKGISFLVHRRRFKYLDPSKEFTNGAVFNNMVLKKIQPLDDGDYFSSVFIKGSLADPSSYILIKECGGKDPDDLVKMRYKGWDFNGKEVYFPMDVCIIEETYFKRDIEDTIRGLNDHIQKYPDAHAIRFDKVKIGYCVEPEENIQNPAEGIKNSELVTEEIQFYTIYRGGDFIEEMPVFPRLKYARVYIRQLEGIETTPQTYFVGYSTRFIKDGFKEQSNKAKVFLQLLSSAVKTAPFTDTNESINDLFETTGAVKYINGFFEPISNIFSKYYKNVGSLVNPGIRIDNISALPQSLMINERLNELDSITHAPLEDLLRDLDREILGGINLIKIIRKLIALKNAPIMTALEDASGKIRQLDSALTKLNERINALPEEIAKEEARLKTIVANKLADVSQYADKYLHKKNELRRLKGFYFDKARDLVSDLKKRLLTNEWVITDIVYTNIIKAKEYINYFNGLDLFFKDQLTSIQLYVSMHQILDRFTSVKEEPSSAQIIDFITLQKQQILERFNPSFYNNWLSEYAKKVDKIEGYIRQFTPASEKVRIILTTVVKRKLMEVFQTGAIVSIEIDLPSDYLSKKLPDNTTVEDFLKGEKIISGAKKYIVEDNLTPWFSFLSSKEKELKANGETLYKILIDGFNDIHKKTVALVNLETSKVQKELDVLQKQISYELQKQLETYFEKIVTNEVYTSVHQAFDHALDTYHEFVALEEEVRRAAQLFVFNLQPWPQQYNPLPAIEGLVKAKWEDELNDLKEHLPKDDADKVIKFLEAEKGVALKERDQLQGAFDKMQQRINSKQDEYQKEFNNERQKVLDSINEKRQELLNLKEQVRQKVEGFYKEKEEKLKKANEDLVNAYRQGADAYNKAKEAFDAAKKEWDELRAINKKEIHYTWQTTDFEDADLGILQFTVDKRTPTRLDIDVRNTIFFDLKSLPPRLDRIEFVTNSQISNFSLTFLGILTLDFDRVVFRAGNQIKEQFDVVIKNVRFSGPLNFIEVFRSFLKTLDKNLRFDISAEGAMLGYELPLPDITGGAFNFAKAKLAMDLRLPFKAGVPMRFNFGLNTPQEMFLVSCGIFGGRGCFMIGVEPKRGVVLIILVIEFGGVLYLNLGPAEGIAYLFAGIYFRKEYNQVQIRGYITCGGSLNLLGLITASVVFCMGLVGNGKYMDGYCTLNIEIKICAFFTLEIGLTMYKRVYGTSDNSERNDAASQGLKSGLLARGNNDLKTEVTVDESVWDEYFESYYQ